LARKFFAPRDALVIFCAAAVFLVLYFFYQGQGAGSAEVSVSGQAVMTLPLDVDASYSPEGLSVRIAVRGGSVGFVASDCPDKICVHTGFLSRPGQSAACLPNRVAIRVVRAYGDALDSTVY